MSMAKQNKLNVLSPRLRLAAIMLCALLVFAPSRAEAQCEITGAYIAPMGAAVTAITGGISAATATLVGVYTAEITAAQGTLIGLMEAMEQIILNRMNEFWDDWEEAWQDMTAQLHAGLNDQTRQMSSMFDTSNLTDIARSIQRQEDRAKKQYTATEQGCRFDTAATYRAQAARTTAAYQDLMDKEVTNLGTNKSGSLGAGGPDELLQERWSRYENAFCDPNSNGSNAVCGGAMPDANANITPSRTIFGQETIDMTNPNNYLAANEIMLNLTGFEPPRPVMSIASAEGRQERQRVRGYLAQANVATALVASVIAERLPGEEAPEIAAIRSSVGVGTPSDRPSEREIRQSAIEQFWDPNYYINLIDNPSVVAREETFLHAYNLMLLYKLIEKTEKIANAYAVQTANILQKTTNALQNRDSVRGDLNDSVPLR